MGGVSKHIANSHEYLESSLRLYTTWLSMSPITLYAELLLNVRQVTVFATLPSEQNKEFALELSPNRKSVSLTQDGETVTLELPSDVVDETGKPHLASAAKQLSFRFQVPNSLQHSDHIGLNAENTVPWPARSLTVNTEFACRSCKALIIRGQIGEWRDLPSENWAEMMEFWHCHKPEIDVDQYKTSMTTKSATSERLIARRGLGLVDVCHLVVSEDTLWGLKVSSYHL